MAEIIPFHEKDKGKCTTCGFLCTEIITPRLGENLYYEMSPHERSSGGGNLSNQQDDRLCQPSCFRYATFLIQEIGEVSDLNLLKTKDGWGYYEVNTPQQKAAVIVFEKDRKCDKWYPYNFGHSPKEHLEMMRFEEMENQRNEQQLKLAELSQQAQATHTQVMQATNDMVKDLKVIAEANDRFSRRVTAWIILLAVAQVLIGVMSLIIPLLLESPTDKIIRIFTTHQP